MKPMDLPQMLGDKGILWMLGRPGFVCNHDLDIRVFERNAAMSTGVEVAWGGYGLGHAAGPYSSPFKPNPATNKQRI